VTGAAVRLERRAARALGVAALLGALVARPAAAQVPWRGGLWADAGMGYARLRLTCVQCADIATAGGTEFTMTVGGAPTRNVLLGVQGQTWSSSTGRLRQTVRSLTAIIQWYPWPAAGFFVRGGTGLVKGPVTPEATGATPASAQGTGITLDFGVGYDLAVSRHFGIAVQAATHVAALGDLKVNGVAANDVIAYVTRIGVAVVMR
jgi:hypothetical protein